MAFRRSRSVYVPRSPFRRFLDLALTTLLFALMILVIARLEQFSLRTHLGVPAVADGDTLVFGAGRVRLEGIDAPEFTQSCQSPAGTYPCGKEARNQMVRLIGGHPVHCDGWQADKYGRLLVHCTAGTVDINRQMVLLGWAVSYGDYAAEEAQARASRLGVWQGEFVRPSVFRKMKGDVVEPVETPHDLWFKLRQILATLFSWTV